MTRSDYVILKGNKLCIPEQLPQRVPQAAHSFHMGIQKTKMLIREKVWFRNLDKQVETMIKSCHACQKVSQSPQEPPVVMTNLPTSPWKELSLYILGQMNNESVLVLIYTNYPLVAILK
jgi:hypothetical protein